MQQITHTSSPAGQSLFFKMCIVCNFPTFLVTRMRLIIKTLDGKNSFINVDPNDTIERLKKMAEMLTSVPAVSQKLIFSGKVLKDESSVASNALREDSIVHMVIDKNKLDPLSTDSSSVPSTVSQSTQVPFQTTQTTQTQPPLQQSDVDELRRSLTKAKDLGIRLEENKKIVSQTLSSSGMANQQSIGVLLNQTSSLLNEIRATSNSFQLFLPRLISLQNDARTSALLTEVTAALAELSAHFFGASESLSSLQIALDRISNPVAGQDPSTARVNQLFDMFSQINSNPAFQQQTSGGGGGASSLPFVPPSSSQFPFFQQQPQTNNNASNTYSVNNNNNNNSNNQTTSAQSMAFPNAYMMSQTFNLLNESMLKNGGSLGSVIDKIAASINPSVSKPPETEADEPHSSFGQAFQLVLENLTIPEVVSLMDGNWTPLDHLHPKLKQLFSSKMKISNSHQLSSANTNSVEKWVSEAMKEGQMVPLFSLSSLTPKLSHSIKQSYDLPLLVLHTVHKFIAKLILLCLHGEEKGFGLAVKATLVKGSEELMNVFIQSLKEIPTEEQDPDNHPIQVASEIIRFLLTQRLSSFLPTDFAALGTNMVVRYILTNFNNLKNPATNAQLLADVSNWEKVIRVDEIRQQNTKPQPPFSDSYLQASTTKRRRVARMIETNPSRALSENLSQAIKNVKLENKIPESEEQRLLPQFLSLLSKDVKEQLSANSEEINPILSNYENLKQFSSQSQ